MRKYRPTRTNSRKGKSKTTIKPRTPIARSVDPDTSHQAAHEITADGTRDRQATMMLEACCRWPGRTSRELVSRLGLGDRYIGSRRLPELRDMGMVTKGEPKICGISGKRAATWFPTSKGRLWYDERNIN